MRRILLSITVAGAFLSGTAQLKYNVPKTVQDTITDEDIVYPESFETDVQNMMTDWYMQKYAVLDDSCVKHSSIVTYPDSVYIRKLSQLPTAIEMPYNQIVRSYIDMYTVKRRMLVESMLGRSTYYMPIFEQALEKAGLPIELKYLPIIESALIPNATSRAGAAGLWQFMIGTAKNLGLEVNSMVDERRDPYKSSEKAAQYLRDLYAIYHNWPLVIASYNCGPGNVNKAIRRAGGKTDYWEIYEFLPKETRGYVPAFIAANYVMHYYRDHNICPVLTKRPLIVDTINVDRQVHFQQIADVLQIPIEQIRDLNPQYRKDIIPGHIKPYMLALPSQQVFSFIESQDTIYAHNASDYTRRTTVEPASFVAVSSAGNSTGNVRSAYHRVKRGENLSVIANRYGVSVSNLRKWNGLKNNNIRAGQRLRVGSRVVAANDDSVPDSPGPETVQKSVKKQEVKSTKSNQKSPGGNFRYHTVVSGESLWSISQKYKGVSDKDIKRANNLRNNSIRPGQKLKIPRT